MDSQDESNDNGFMQAIQERQVNTKETKFYKPNQISYEFAKIKNQ